jgi:hypothetical protein
MGKSQRIYKKRKGPDVLKRWNNSKTKISVIPGSSSENTSDISSLPGPSNESEATPSICNDIPITSSSKKKLGSVNETYETVISEFEYCIVDIKVLESLLQTATVCKKCKKNSVALNMKMLAGLACNIEVSCKHCNIISETNNSKCVTDEHNSFYDVNVRLVYGMRSIGKGKAAADMFCAIMNLPQPPYRYFKYEQFLSSVSESLCKDSMAGAVKEAITENGGNADLAVAVDGSWQKRGHTSLNGIVSATSVSTGKVLDIEILSKYCKCSNRSDNLHDENCFSNYTGTSGGMEVAGAVAIFNRSLSQYGVRYLDYLGDGDSRAFKSVSEAKPYGDCAIKKLECIGHIQKRMGTRLRALRAMKSVLEDGKPLTGKNRLTLEAVSNLQLYYGLAIRRNHHSVEQMKKAIWSTYLHVCATDTSTEKHAFCPQDPATTWCKYVKAQSENITYKHAEHFHLPVVVMRHLKPVYKDLTDSRLLEKCLAGKTQNPNESLNNCIWSVLPKQIFVALKTLKFGVFEAVSKFNRGNITKCELFTKIGLDPGKNLILVMKKLDVARISKSEKYIEEIQKKLRRKRESVRRKLEDRYEEEEGVDPSYASGQFS